MKLPFPPESETPEIILTKESLTFIRTWMDENSEGVPAAIRPFILAMLDMCEDAQVLLKNNKKLVELLRQHMGFIPTKEREGKGKKDPALDEWTKEGENSLLQKMRKRSRMNRGLTAIREWCRRNRHLPMKEQHAGIIQRLRGHYNYYGGARENLRSLQEFRYKALVIWRRWLCRRSGQDM